jgi:hypothetical protein
MGKMQNALLITLALEISMMIFYNGLTNTSFLSFLLNPTSWSSSGFIDMLQNKLFLAVGTVAILAGLYFIRNDFIFYATIAASLLTFGAVYYQLYQWIYSQSIFGVHAPTIALIVTAPLLIYYIFATLDFARGRD